MFKKALLFIVFPTLIIAQKKVWTQIEIDSFVHNNHLTHERVEEYRKMLLTNNKLKGWSKYYSTMAHIKYNEGENEISNSYADSALHNPRDPNFANAVNEHSTMQAYYFKSVLARANKNYEESTKYMLRALDVEKKFPYKYKSFFRATIANNHLDLGNNEKALEFYLRNLADTAYTNLAQPHVVTLSFIGLLYTSNYLNKPDSAYTYLKMAEKTSFEKGYKDYLPFVYSYLGGIFRETHQDSALHYFKLSKKEFETYSVIPNISPETFRHEQAVNNAYISLREGKNELVISELPEVLTSLENFEPSKKTRDILLDGYDYIILAAQNLNNMQLVNEYLRKKISFLTKFHKHELQSEMEKITVAYETKEKEKEIDQLKLESQNKDLLVAKKKYQVYLISVAAAILILLTVMGFRNQLTKNKLQKVSLEQQLLRSQMNPHFIYNVMQNIAILIKTEPIKAKQFIIEFGVLLRLNLENSRNEFVELQDEIEALNKYMSIYSKMVTAFDYKIKVDDSINPDKILIPPMLIQPLVENAIKHGLKGNKGPGKIIIELKKISKDELKCTVLDNGVGFSSAKKSDNSLALKIISERLSIYHGKRKTRMLNISDKKENGNDFTQVTIHLPFEA